MLKALIDPLSDKLGTADTLPWATVCFAAAPTLVTVMLPDRLPKAAVRPMRTVTGTSRRPCEGVRTIVRAYGFLCPVTSKPAGAVTVTLPVRSDPETEKIRPVEAVPSRVVSSGNIPLSVNNGGGTTFPVTGNERSVAPVEEIITVPEGDPTLVVAAIRR